MTILRDKANPEFLLRAALMKHLNMLEEQDVHDIEIYIDNNEYALAYDLLLFLFKKNKINIPIELIRVAKLMNVAADKKEKIKG